MAFTITVVTLVIVLLSAIYYHFTRTFNYWKKRNVPGPKPWPMVGNQLKSTLRQCTVGAVLKDIYESYPDEKVVGIYRMTTPALLVRDLDILKHVLIKDFDNFVDRGFDFGEAGLGQNIFHTDGESWRALRSRLTPIFTNQKLKNMMHLLNDRGDQFVEYVREVTKNTPEHDIYGLVQKYTLSAITACAFGLDIDTFRGDIEALKKVDSAIFDVNYVIELDLLYPGLLKYLNMDIFPSIMKKFFRELVETVVTQRNGVPSNRHDFMDSMLEIKNKKEVEIIQKSGNNEANKTLKITNNIIEGNAFAFYAAGYETSASTLGFMLYHLALDTTMQDTLRNEIDEYLQRHDNRIEVDTLNELTYLGQVFSETLRMYPIVETLQRRAQHEYEFPGTNVKVAKGQTVMVSVTGIHHDKKHYPDPQKFDPNRFSPENIADRHACAYLPFGLGPRHCIGMRFAHLQSRVCLIRLLSNFTLEAGKNTARSFTYNPKRIVLTPKDRIYVNIVPRKA